VAAAVAAEVAGAVAARRHLDGLQGGVRVDDGGEEREVHPRPSFGDVRRLHLELVDADPLGVVDDLLGRTRWIHLERREVARRVERRDLVQDDRVRFAVGEVGVEVGDLEVLGDALLVGVVVEVLADVVVRPA